MVTPVIRRGDIWWAELPEPRGSEPGYRRPVLVIQSNDFNRSQIATVLTVILTSNMALAEAPGNVLLTKSATGLAKDSVANVSQVYTIDKLFLKQRAGKVSEARLKVVEAGLKLVMALD
jgi:mRNA interferase MazF